MKRALACLLAFLLAACARTSGEAPAASAKRAPLVATSFYPLTWLVERLVDPEVAVFCPLPAGADPAFWVPERAALERLQAADLIVLNGAHFEDWAGAASLPPSRVVESADGFRARWRTLPGLVHSHGGGGTHSHEGVDGHTWVAPTLFAQQAEAVGRALVEHGLVAETELAPRLAALRSALLDDWPAFRDELARLAANVRVLTSHPSYGYLLSEAGVEPVELALDPEQPWEAATRAAVAAAKGDAARALLLWESAPAPGVAEALASELGVRSLVFSPAENPAPDELAAGDFAALQRVSRQRLLSALRELQP